ncbi:MAG: hypothetical protein J6X80_07685 [Lachnospiraceae bacterium]|nr:hypothetical protein [Lachnospiraceae bacterium]
MKFRLTFVFLILGIALAVLGGKGLVTSVLPAKDLYDPNVDWSKLKSGQRVYVEIDYIWDAFEETTNDSGSSVSRLYALPDIQAGNDGYYIAHFIGVTVPSKEYYDFEKLNSDSIAWEQGEYDQLGERGYITFDGYLKKMGKEEQGFLRDYLRDNNYTDSEIDDMIIPLSMVRNQALLTNVLMFAGGILLTIVGAIFGFVFFLKKPNV